MNGNIHLENDIMEDDDEQVKASASPFQRKRSGEEKSEDGKSESEIEKIFMNFSNYKLIQ